MCDKREAELTIGTIPVWRKIGYGMGEMGSQFSWAMVSSYLTIYYTANFAKKLH